MKSRILLSFLLLAFLFAGFCFSEVKEKKVGYLGIRVGKVPEVLTAQLNLQKDVGIIVAHIEEKSPAEKGGIKQHDIIEKFEDQIIFNPNQFKSLVRAHEPGKKVNFAIIRKGEQKRLKIKLGSIKKKEIRFGGKKHTFEIPEFKFEIPDFSVQMEQLDSLKRALKKFKPGAKIKKIIKDFGSGSLVSYDGKYTVNINYDRNKRHVLVKDNDGAVLYDDTLNSVSYPEKLPGDAVQLIKNLDAVSKPLEMDY